MSKLSTYLSYSLFLLITVVFYNCSTEKNSFVNRSYHNITAKYNGYFNARELIKVNMENFRGQYKDDYTQRLPIEVYPDKEEAQQLYPDMDTAISKSEKVITKHSMPNPAKSRKTKKEEHCKWIDDNWLVIGQAHYIKYEHDEAVKKLKYVRSTYSEERSVYAANMWLARISMDQDNIPDATKYLKDVEAALEKLESLKEEKKEKKSKRQKKNDKKEKTKEPEKFPKKWMAEYLLLKARLALMNNETEEATTLMKEALDEHVKGRDNKGRINFILGQLYQEMGRGSEAAEAYTVAIKKAAKYEMAFHARINRAIANGKDGDGLEKDLKKMLKDDKNIEYRDQIYYALADISLQRSDKKTAIYNLHKSAFYSINNDRQKGMSYLKLGDLHFDDKKYIKAKGYYDSAVIALPETFPDFLGIQYKAESLNELVDNFEVVELQDSLQKIAALDPSDREKRLKDIVKQIEKEREEEKRREEKRLADLQQMKMDASSQGGDGSDWYFYNTKLMVNGSEEFKKLWGDRTLEDNWRRSNKVANAFVQDENDTTEMESGDVEAIPTDSLSVDLLASSLPLTPGAIDSSNNLLMNALYNLGVVYKEQLNDPAQSQGYFQRILDKDVEHDKVLPAAYQLYRLNVADAAKNQKYKDYILNNYPNSDFANAIRDPEFYRKQQERLAQDRLDYEELYEKYEKGYYGLIIAKVNRIATTDTANAFLPKYLLLKAFAISKTGNATISAVRSPLDDIIEKYPNSEEATYAKQMIDNYEKSLTEKPQETVEAPTNLPKYTYNPDEEHLFVYIPGDKVNVNAAKARLSNFKNQYFRAKNYSLLNLALDKQNIIVVKIFIEVGEAKNFQQTFENTSFKRDPVLKSGQFFIISKSNFQELNKNQELEPYLTFYQENYESL